MKNEEHNLLILENIEKNPNMTQADLAAQLGIAVGSVNWYLKRLIKKGFVKATKLQRRRLRYLLTPQGVTEKSRLTASFMQSSLKWYRVTREDTKGYLQRVRHAGFDTVCIEGDGDLSEIVYLSCLEAGVSVLSKVDLAYPVFRIEGLQTILEMPTIDGGGVL